MPTLAPGDSALLVVPPQPVAMAIQPWRLRFDPNAEIIPPHITLAYPSFVPILQWAEARLRLRDVMSRFEPFEIRLRETGVFPGQPAVLWIRPSDNGELVCLHNTLEVEFSDFWSHSEYPFVPHLTIGFFETQDQLVAAQDMMESGFQPQAFVATKIVYAVLDAAGKWREVDSLPFRAIPRDA